MAKTRHGQMSHTPVCVMNEMCHTVDKMNDYALLAELRQEELKNFKSVWLFTLGGGLNHIGKVHVTKHKETITGPNGKASKQEVEKENKNIMKQKVGRPIKMSKVPKGAKLLDLVLSVKKKADGTLQCRLIAHGCSQKDKELYDSSSIHGPITKGAMIYIMLMLILMAN